MENINNTQEIVEGIITEESLRNKLNNGSVVILKGKTKPLLIGKDLLVKVNTNIGVAEENQTEVELNKLRLVSSLGFKPDTMMDQTIVHLKKPFWKTMLETFDGPIGTLPHYLSYSNDKGIDESALLELLEEMLVDGISFMTLHPTPNREVFEKARKSRIIPSTSRGGSIVIHDMLLNRRDENIISSNFQKILKLFKKHNAVISIGSTFRPATILEALDECHMEDTILQKMFVMKARQYGVQVMMEGIGHVKLGRIQEYSNLISEINVPFMPLGPIPTDSASGFDHISSAIGSTFMGMQGTAHIFNSITREEHTGGVPTTESVIEGLKTARVAAHCVNVSKFDVIAQIDKEVTKNRALHKTCVVGGGILSQTQKTTMSMGCSRCNDECPLRLSEIE